MLETQNLSKKFGQIIALDDISLCVQSGEIACVLGPSGSGKSTLLRVIAGLEQPDSGQIFIDGKDATNVEALTRGAALVFQSYALYPSMSVFGNVLFPLRMRSKGWTWHRQVRADARRKAIQTIETLGISECSDRRPSQLSGGQQQRVALARAMVRKPSVFLLDEPLSNLDEKLRSATRDWLRDVLKSSACPIVYVTHDQHEAMSFGDKVAIMNKGRIVQVGTPQEIYSKPNHLFVAGFIGSPPMNTLLGTAAIIDRFPAIKTASGTFKLPLAADEALAKHFDGEALCLAFRPHTCNVLSQIKREANQAVGELKRIENLGDRSILRFTAEQAEINVVQRPDQVSWLRVGQQYGIEVQPSNLMVFDALEGRRLWP